MDLVIGAAGHIGNVLVRELSNRGRKVRALILPGEDRSPLLDSKSEIVEGNVLDYSSLLEAMDGVEVVFHLASLVAIVPDQYPQMQKVNVEGTANVVKACIEKGVRRLIYTSSIHAYGHPDPNIIIDERLPFDLSGDGYDRTKAEASKIVIEAAKNGLNAVVLAPTGVLGPYDFKRSEMGEMTYYWMKKSPTFSIKGAYDFVDVRDVVEAHIKAIDKGEAGEAYLLPAHRISVRDYRAMVQKAAGANGLEIFVPTWLVRAVAPFAEWLYRLQKKRPRLTRYAVNTLLSNSRISGEKAAKVLDFHPRPLDETVKDSVKWWSENGMKIKPTVRQTQLSRIPEAKA